MKKLPIWIVTVLLALGILTTYVGWIDRHEVGYLPFALGILWIIFALASAPREALLRVRLFRSGTVRINGREVALEPAPGGNWKRERKAGVAAMLLRGKNTIEATARSGLGGRG